MTTIDVLEALEKTSSRLEKEKILKEHSDLANLPGIFLYALDPYKTYGITKFKKPKHSESRTSSRLEAEAAICGFFNRLDELNSRVLTGNAARDALTSFFVDLTPLEQKWFERILLKNLRCGVSRETVNKIWPSLVPQFSVQLADEVKYSYFKEPDGTQNFKIIEEIAYPVWVDPKLDGLRMIAIKTKGVVTLFSRGGQEFENFPHIKKAIEELPEDECVFDGEVMGEDWNATQSVAFSTTSKKDDSKTFYNIFDQLSFIEWETQKSVLAYVREDWPSRRSNLESLMKNNQSPYLRLVEGLMVANENELREQYSVYLDQGYEGLMVKDPNSTYVFDRSKAVRKLKPTQTFDGKIVGMFEGKPKTKWEGKFGGWLVQLPNQVITRVGGGFSDDQRNGFTSQIEKYGFEKCGFADLIVEVEGQHLTKDGRIRNPVFLRFRNPSDVDPKVVNS